MTCLTARVHDGRHLGMLEWLVNCFRKALVGILDWQRMPRELKVLSRGGPRIFMGIQMLELLVNCFLKALVGIPDC